MGMSVYIIGFWFKGIKYRWCERVGRFISPLNKVGYISVPIGAYDLEIRHEGEL